MIYNEEQIQKCISRLLDPKNEIPHYLFLGEEIDGEEIDLGLFHQFRVEANKLILDKESAIAERLAITTPQNHRSKVAFAIENTFPKSILALKTRAAFDLRRSIETVLLGDNPKEFFTRRDC